MRPPELIRERVRPSARRTTRVVRLAIVALAGLALAAGVYVVATTSPTRDSIYPKCVTYTATGIHCPGCGTGRAAHFLLTGHPLAAIRCNLFAPFLLPFLTVALFRTLIRWALDRPASATRPLHTAWLWALVGAMLLYAVLRNVPSEPFTHLAPKEVETEVASPP